LIAKSIVLLVERVAIEDTFIFTSDPSLRYPLTYVVFHRPAAHFTVVKLMMDYLGLQRMMQSY